MSKAFEEWAGKSVAKINLARSGKVNSYYVSEKTDNLYRAWEAGKNYAEFQQVVAKFNSGQFIAYLEKLKTNIIDTIKDLKCGS